MSCLHFFQEPYSNGQTREMFESNEYSNNGSQDCVLGGGWSWIS